MKPSERELAVRAMREAAWEEAQRAEKTEAKAAKKKDGTVKPEKAKDRG